MADALCGPSNALQNFQKHSAADRNLQQDRLVSRPSPSQGFRSGPGPNAGLLDPEFEAFQSGQLLVPSTRPEPQTFQPVVPFQPVPAPQQSYQVGTSSWATDFQQLSVSSPPPRLQQQQYPQQTQFGGWMNEFAKQQNQATSPSVPLYSNFKPQFERLSTLGPASDSVASQEEGFDEEAFARAFDQAAISELELERELEMHPTVAENTVQHLGADMIDDPRSKIEESEVPRLGADAIDDPRSNSELAPKKEDPDALARTAGQLLDSVKDNQSSKFQNSQFLSLMRLLRDKEVMVKGDKIVVAEEERRGVEEVG